MKAAIVVLILGSSCLPCAVMAGGTLDADEVFATIKQRVEIAEVLASSLEFRCTAFADTVLGSAAVPALGGARIGPYTLWARRRGSKGVWTLQVTVETRARWQDASGTEVPEDKFPMATAVKEQLEGVKIKVCKEVCDAQAEDKPCQISASN